VITRVYLTKWETRYYVEGDEYSRYVWHPLLDVAEQVTNPQKVLFKNPTATATGEPSKTAILVFVTAEAIPDSIADIEGVYMFPPHPLGYLMDNISDEVKAGVIAKLDKYGIAYEDIDGSVDVAEFLEKVAASSSIINKSVPPEFNGREDEFA